MANNVVELVSREFSPNVIGRLASSVGESNSSTARAASIGAPVVLAGLAQRAGTETGAADLLNDIRAGGYDRADARSPMEALDDPSSRQQYAEGGRRINSSIFGNRQDGVLGTLADQTGLKKGSLAVLMSLIAPIAMRVIGGQVRERNFDAKGLQTYLGGQRAAIASVLPSPLAKMLDTEHVTTTTVRPVARNQILGSRHELGQEGEVRRRPLWPFLAAALAALALFTMARSNRPPAVGPTPAPIPEPAARAPEPPAVEPPAPPTAPPPPEFQPPSEPVMPPPAIGGGPRTELDHPSSGGVHALALYLASHGASGQKNDFVLEGVTFATASASLSKEGTEKVGELGALLKSHPNAKIKLVGHTDDTGDAEANRALSQDRANAVRDELVQQGIDESRIETAGVGADDPIARNDSPANKEKNRRIDVIVLSQ